MASPPVEGDSVSSTVPGVTGTNSSPSAGVIVLGAPQPTGESAAVLGNSQYGVGVHGISGEGSEAGPNTGGSGVFGEHTGGGNGVYGTSVSGNAVAGKSTKGNAGWFDGPVYVNGNVDVTGDVVLSAVSASGGDCAEEFEVTGTADIEPGTVMVLDQNGALRSSQQAYDKRVAGVISGAGDYKPGLILDRKESSEGRVPIALIGKVYCKVDAQYVAIEVGDLLTTSPTPGHAMKAADPLKAFGTVIGKALRPLEGGQGLIPILVALQ
jgi:hypothetical protein